MRALLIVVIGVLIGPPLVACGPIGIGVLVFVLILIGNVGKTPEEMNQ